MKLPSRDGAGVELRPVRYQFPSIRPRVSPRKASEERDWDANWLIVRGDVRMVDGRRWSFEDPCLTTWEASELADWLRRVASGHVPPSPPGDIEKLFTEPNVAFSLEGRDDGRVRLRVHLSLEALPPWSRDSADRPEVLAFFVVVDLSTQELTTAASEWTVELAPFAER